MGKEVDSGALGLINRILGIAGSRTGAQSTELDDGVLVQTLDVAGVVRQGRAPAASGGLYRGVLQNVHSAADDERSQIDPYNPGASAFGGWPGAVPEGFDIWVLKASLVRSAGAGDMTGGQLRLFTNFATSNLGWGEDDAGAAFSSSQNPILAAWEGAANTNTAAGFAWYPETGTAKVVADIGIRLRRGYILTLDTTSSAALTCQCVMQVAIYPSAVGQDAIA